MLRKFKDSYYKMGQAVGEFPMVLLMAFLGAVTLMCFAELNFDAQPENFFFVKFTLVSVLGISLMFALKMLAQRIGKTVFLEICGVLLLIAFYFILPQKEDDFTEKFAFLLIPTFVLSHLFVSFAAFLSREKELNFWQYNKNLFINIFLTAIFTGVLTGGVELAVLAVDKLFDFNFNDKIYPQIFYLLSIFGSALIFVLFSQGGLRTLEKDGSYPEILKFFTQYILIPLLIIYAFILYFYAAKIVFKWELPRGWVSYLILAYSIVGIFALLIVHPLKQNSAKSWVRMFSRIFYFSLFPLLFLLFVAIFTRILEYGYTEPRYFVLLLAVWLGSVVLYFNLAQKPTIKYIPVSLFVFGIFSLTVPYLNTFSVAKRSQRAEFSKILIENNLLKDQKIDFGTKVTDTIADEVSNKFMYLMQRSDSAFVVNFLSEKDRRDIFKAKNHRQYGGLRAQFSDIIPAKNTVQTNRLEIFSQNKIRDISGYDYMFCPEDFDQKMTVNVGNDIFIFENISNVKDPTFKITLNNNKSWDLKPFLNGKIAKYKVRSGRVEQEEISAEKQLGDYTVKVYFNNIIAEKELVQRMYFNVGYILIAK
ncbi:DUF4153 domain-containing protein [Kaistella rhinocerotis]|uniref:DUF4153 domain-containing protein n=1 Tax=Kaistella rhinocerotis TaxID=3026437 RepID=UPI002556C895|nr:DUF4153 domain-containing protein [Kaistella sp. Ran72]